MKRKLIGTWHAAAFLTFCFVLALTASGVFYNQRGKLAGEFGNMVAANLTSYTQAQKRYLNSSITDAWNTLKGISGLVEQIVPDCGLNAHWPPGGNIRLTAPPRAPHGNLS